MKLRYLHLADLHLNHTQLLGGHWESGYSEQGMILHSMLHTVKQLSTQSETLDFIALTCDITRRGTSEDFQVALNLCKRLLQVTGLPAERLYLLPGNHDADQSNTRFLNIRYRYPFAIILVLNSPTLKFFANKNYV